jgi:phage tail-like protein
MSFAANPFQVFNFEVVFKELKLDAKNASGGRETGDFVEVCSAAFSEVTGLEATMEPKVIKEGGRNFGPVQRVGPVTFATVILKRGITSETDLWTWFELVGGGHYARRMNAYIRVLDPARQQAIRSWKLHRVMPIKFKMPDLSAAGTSVGIEELHLAHEGLELERPAGAGAAGTPAGARP